MSKRMDWRKARLAGRRSLDHRYEFETPDRAERWLKAVERQQRERRIPLTASSSTDVAPFEENGAWVVVVNGQRHAFASNAEAWRWLDRQERRTSWRTVYYEASSS